MAYGEGPCSDSDSAETEERGIIPDKRIDNTARVRRVRDRVREKYISRSVGSRVRGESIVIMSLGEAKRGRAWRIKYADVENV